MSNICSFSMENTHNNVEFGVLQKTSKQSLILIFFLIGRGDTPPPIPTPRSALRPSIKGFALVYTNSTPPPIISYIRPCSIVDFKRYLPTLRSQPRLWLVNVNSWRSHESLQFMVGLCLHHHPEMFLQFLFSLSMDKLFTDELLS